MTLTAYLRQYYSFSTAKCYQRSIENYLSNCKQADKAMYKDIVQYIGTLRKPHRKGSTVCLMASGIKVYYNYLCHAGIRADNPAKSIMLKDRPGKDKQLQDLFNPGELDLLLNRKEHFTKQAFRNKVLISLFIYQALRPVEAAALTTQDINVEQGSIYIKATPLTNARELPLKPNQVLLFYQYLHELRPKLLLGNPSDKLLLGFRGDALSAEGIISHILVSFKGMYPGRTVSAQKIRQSVITNLLKQGHDISMVQLFGGYKSADTVRLYSTKQLDTLQEAIKKYHPIQ